MYLTPLEIMETTSTSATKTFLTFIKIFLSQGTSSNYGKKLRILNYFQLLT